MLRRIILPAATVIAACSSNHQSSGFSSEPLPPAPRVSQCFDEKAQATIKMTPLPDNKLYITDATGITTIYGLELLNQDQEVTKSDAPKYSCRDQNTGTDIQVWEDLLLGGLIQYRLTPVQSSPRLI